jgi:uncharacterized membrane protein YeaQ/YmgE (transglycosylase-associated protein family)
MGILWTILIGFIAGVLAKLITPGDNEPSGFILTTILGIVGAFVATYLGQALGWYTAGEECWSHWCDRWGSHRTSYLGRHCWQAARHPSLDPLTDRASFERRVAGPARDRHRLGGERGSRGADGGPP